MVVMVSNPTRSEMRLVDSISDILEPVRATDLIEPRLDMYEENNQLIVKADLPGVEPNSLDIGIDNGVLYINGSRHEDVSDKANYFVCERCADKFSRCINLPFPVDTDKASATFDNGILELKLPRSKESRVQHIQLKAGKPHQLRAGRTHTVKA